MVDVRPVTVNQQPSTRAHGVMAGDICDGHSSGKGTADDVQGQRPGMPLQRTGCAPGSLQARSAQGAAPL